ncbi:hypothetical protein STHU_09050 [Allostella humosa]|nr:hypothetical protein STHU_09050 [Stella humosa]
MAADYTRTERAAHANAVIEEIAKVGRRFFWSEEHQRVSRFDFDTGGRLILVDRETGRNVHVTQREGWHNFSEGGTLRAVVEALAGYIREGVQINPRYFGPWPAYICDGDLWGYGEAMAPLRAALAANPALRPSRCPTPTSSSSTTWPAAAEKEAS